MGFETLWALALGLSFSVCAGFRAIVPLFILALGHRFAPGAVPLGESFDWLSSSPALIALAAALILEVAADKVPAVDHAVDVVQTPIRTLAGAALAVAPFVDLPPWAFALLTLLGGASALTVHGAKATTRAASTATTGGLANPLISTLEDVLTIGLCLLALVLAPVVLLLMALAVAWAARRLWRWRRGELPRGDVL